MSIHKDWMIEDNSGEWAKAKLCAGAFHRAVRCCISVALWMDRRKNVVGAGFERAKDGMTPEELAAIRTAKGEDWNKIRPL